MTTPVNILKKGTQIKARQDVAITTPSSAGSSPSWIFYGEVGEVQSVARFTELASVKFPNFSQEIVLSIEAGWFGKNFDIIGGKKFAKAPTVSADDNPYKPFLKYKWEVGSKVALLRDYTLLRKSEVDSEYGGWKGEVIEQISKVVNHTTVSAYKVKLLAEDVTVVCIEDLLEKAVEAIPKNCYHSDDPIHWADDRWD